MKAMPGCRLVTSYKAGITNVERAVALDSYSADAHYALFYNLGRKAERSGIALQAFSVGKLRRLIECTVELGPRHAHAWSALGEMLLRLPWILGGSDADGRGALERAARLAPEWYQPRLRLAEHFHDTGKKPRALRSSRRRKLAILANKPEAAKAVRRIIIETPDS